jgi:hypothetical protein
LFFPNATGVYVTAIVLIVAAAPAFFRVAFENKTLDDFHVIYCGARAMLDRAEIHTATNGMYIYSPFLAFVFQPLALVSERLAAMLWLIASGIIFVTAVFLASLKIAKTWQFASPRNSGGAHVPWLIAAGALLLSFEKLRSEFILGQTDCLILLGLSLILCFLNSRLLTAAVLVGVTANFKYLALIFVPYFIAKRNYRAALVSIVSFAFFFLLPAVEIGRQLISDYIVNAAAVLAKVIGGRELAHQIFPGPPPVVNFLTWNNSVSLTSSFFRFGQSLHLSNTITVLGIAILLVGVVVTLVAIGQRNNLGLFRSDRPRCEIARAQTTSLEWAALIVLALVFGPQTTARHMIMLVLVYPLGIVLAFTEDDRPSRIFLVGLMITTAVSLSLPFRETGAHPLLLALKLGGVASWFALLLVFSICARGSRQIDQFHTKTEKNGIQPTSL